MASSSFNKIPTIGDYRSITLPFTAPSDGFILLRVNPSSETGARVVLVVNGLPASVSTSNGYQVSTTTPVKRGGVVTEGVASQNYSVWFIPLV